MIVVDAAAVLEALLGDEPDPELVIRLADEDLHAPHLLDIEILHSLRVIVTRGAASSERVEAARTDSAAMEITRYPHVGLRDRIWRLRHNLSAYDAAYVALAEVLGVPLVTTDARVAGAQDTRIDVEVFGRSDRLD